MNQADKDFLTDLFWTAVDAADPMKALPPYLPPKPKGRTIIIGAGKGAAQMAAAFEKLWGAPVSGLIVTRFGFGVACQHVDLLEASHPVPDQNGIDGTQKLLSVVASATADDLIVALICGGGSALLACPPEGFELADEIALNEALLASGAPISAMNAVRKQFSRVKGGRLAALSKAPIVSLIVSDVPGDDPSEIASGPTVPDGSTAALAAAAIDEFGIKLSAKIDAYIRQSPDAPRPDDAVFAKNEVHIVSSARISLNAAAEKARAQGVAAEVLSDKLEGEARDEGQKMGSLAVARAEEAPLILLSGGECTVTIRAKGKGGPNSEFQLGLASAIDGDERIFALSADTDGIDGSEDNAGAFADGRTAAKLRASGKSAEDYLSGNDSWSAFDGLGDIFAPGPTGTNVNDFRAVWVKPKG